MRVATGGLPSRQACEKGIDTGATRIDAGVPRTDTGVTTGIDLASMIPRKLAGFRINSQTRGIVGVA